MLGHFYSHDVTLLREKEKEREKITDNAIGYLVPGHFSIQFNCSVCGKEFRNKFGRCTFLHFVGTDDSAHIIKNYCNRKRSKSGGKRTREKERNLEIEKERKAVPGKRNRNRPIETDTYIEYISCGRRLDVMSVEMSITFNFASLVLFMPTIIPPFVSVCLYVSNVAWLLPTRKFIFMFILVVSYNLLDWGNVRRGEERETLTYCWRIL